MYRIRNIPYKHLFALWQIGIAYPVTAAVAPSETVGLLKIFENREITEKFFKEIPIPDKINGRTPKKCIYGNRDIGYWKVNVESIKGQLLCRFLPPDYRHPIQIKIEFGTGETSVPYKSLQFESPCPPFLREAAVHKVRGNLESPFYMMQSSFFTEEDGGRTRQRNLFLYIVNKFGDIVWVYFPGKGLKVFGRKDPGIKIIPKPLGMGRYGLLIDTEETYFEEIDVRGRQILEVKPLASTNPYGLHHDFLWQDGGQVLSFSSELRYLRNPKRFWETPETFVGSTLVEFSQAGIKKLWDPFRAFVPGLEPDWDWSFDRNKNTGFWVGPNDNRARYDFIHLNSIEEKSGEGFLLSLRNLSKLVFLSKDFKKIIWTMGAGNKNTYRPSVSSDRFRVQHHASFLPNGDILLLDNGKEKSRVMEIHWEGQSGNYHSTAVYEPDPPLYSPTRGSAYLLPGGKKISAFFVLFKEEGGVVNELIEFDRSTKKESARMEISHPSQREGYRALPLLTIGLEQTFYGLQ